MSLFRMELPAWYYREKAVLNGLIAAKGELDQAKSDDERRTAERKVARYDHALKRLTSQRERGHAMARALLNWKGAA